MSESTTVQREKLREHLHIHVRLCDQGITAESDQVLQILDQLPNLTAFRTNNYDSLVLLLDWDHQIPSKYISARVLASYTGHETRRVSTLVRARSQTIERENLFPEFDVPDYEDVAASERYHLIFDATSMAVMDTRFESDWRKEVPPEDLNTALTVLAGHQVFQRANAQRRSENLGGPILMGWSPPMLSDGDSWTLEFWLVTQFDGQHGTALVCMVDIDNESVAKHYMTEVSIR